MKLTPQGIRLIKTSEGLRPRAYRDAVGVLTIGYGHTRMAGPPEVKQGMVISEKEAEDILRRDLSHFSGEVSACLPPDCLNDNQFSAIVSFAYNVGMGNFRSSSIYRAIKADKLDEVPRRLSYWTKAGGRQLPGLVKRRSAEAALFMMSSGNGLMAQEIPHFRADELADMQRERANFDAPNGTPMPRSTTFWATLTGGAMALMGTVSEALYRVRDFTYGIELSPRAYGWISASVIVVAAGIWIVSERYKHARDDDV